MAQPEELKYSGNTRLPEELKADLRKAQARYQSRGKAAPSFGALLMEAWRVYSSPQGPLQNDKNCLEVLQSSPDTIVTENSTILDVLDRIRQVQTQVAESLRGLEQVMLVMEGIIRGSRATNQLGEPRDTSELDALLAENRRIKDRVAGAPGVREVRQAGEKADPKPAKEGTNDV